MRKIVPVAVAVLLLSASGAWAQSKSGPSTPPATSGAGNIPQAPIGHRQPRASEVPSIQEKNYIESPEDKALDRKIKSICKGC